MEVMLDRVVGEYNLFLVTVFVNMEVMSDRVVLQKRQWHRSLSTWGIWYNEIGVGGLLNTSLT